MVVTHFPYQLKRVFWNETRRACSDPTATFKDAMENLDIIKAVLVRKRGFGCPAVLVIIIK